jgi:hypothetical protein
MHPAIATPPRHPTALFYRDPEMSYPRLNVTFMDNTHAFAFSGALLALAEAIERLADGLSERETPTPADQLAEIRRDHPNAYARWTSEEDTNLRQAYEAGEDIKRLAFSFGRRENVIRARLTHLMFPQEAQDASADP